MKLYNNYCCY